MKEDNSDKEGKKLKNPNVITSIKLYFGKILLRKDLY